MKAIIGLGAVAAALSCGVLATSPASAQSRPGRLMSAASASDRAVEAPIRTMVLAFNKGDVALAKSTHVADPMILDEPTAPFAWSGPKAFEDWIAALGQSEAKAGKTGGKVALGAVTRASVMGDHAYVVVPSTYTFQQAGRTMRETGTMTFALVKQSAEWKIQAWTWTSPEAVPVKR
jgi:ketosteroid isomerase-like protein